MAKQSQAASATTPHGIFHWNELMTRDVEGARTFYTKTIGWQFEAMAMPEMTYLIAKVGDKPAAGIFEMKGPAFENVPEHWLPYLAVDNVEERVEKALKVGATIIRPVFEVPGIGRIAILHQPGGASVGWMTPATASS